ncbi:DNA ligase-1 [Colwellia chukchiensis]|uniref:DNA ligase-1 n=1 Tax=Colwellia chukchiensis TaxID=641665 RepID=A0A1H7L7X4_9GAMM|nr:DNA ligase [Colwellia chukchiensis]SEK94930.1 DNA ligase-1 [Colwellia chukchiensis]
MSNNKYAIVRYILCCLISCIIVQPASYATNEQIKPKLQHASFYQQDIAINNYWVSEKLDGVRGYWDGTHLMTRRGNILSAPSWFTEHWPNFAMDGELWSSQGEFDKISGCVRRKTGSGSCWKNLKLMIFDLPQHSGDFTTRIHAMQKLVSNNRSTYLEMVPQRRLSDNQALQALLSDIVHNNGEGLMLHLASATHQSGRSKNLLKLKQYQDAEAKVIAHTRGKGKYLGLLGAIKVATPEGIIFKIGTGFSKQDRQHPPAIGSIITYKYLGKTPRGVPRFVSFLRSKIDH